MGKEEKGRCDSKGQVFDNGIESQFQVRNTQY